MTPDLETSAESTARGQLRRIVVRLEELRLQLLGLQATLPEPAAELERLADVGDPRRRRRDPRRHRLRAGGPDRAGPPRPPGGVAGERPALPGERGLAWSCAPEDEDTRDESYAGCGGA